MADRLPPQNPESSQPETPAKSRGDKDAFQTELPPLFNTADPKTIRPSIINPKEKLSPVVERAQAEAKLNSPILAEALNPSSIHNRNAAATTGEIDLYAGRPYEPITPEFTTDEQYLAASQNDLVDPFADDPSITNKKAPVSPEAQQLINEFPDRTPAYADFPSNTPSLEQKQNGLVIDTQKHKGLIKGAAPTNHPIDPVAEQVADQLIVVRKAGISELALNEAKTAGIEPPASIAARETVKFSDPERIEAPRSAAPFAQPAAEMDLLNPKATLENGVPIPQVAQSNSSIVSTRAPAAATIIERQTPPPATASDQTIIAARMQRQERRAEMVTPEVPLASKYVSEKTPEFIPIVRAETPVPTLDVSRSTHEFAFTAAPVELKATPILPTNPSLPGAGAIAAATRAPRVEPPSELVAPTSDIRMAKNPPKLVFPNIQKQESVQAALERASVVIDTIRPVFTQPSPVVDEQVSIARHQPPGTIKFNIAPEPPVSALTAAPAEAPRTPDPKVSFASLARNSDRRSILDGLTPPVDRGDTLTPPTSVATRREMSVDVAQVPTPDGIRNPAQPIRVAEAAAVSDILQTSNSSEQLQKPKVVAAAPYQKPAPAEGAPIIEPKPPTAVASNERFTRSNAAGDSMDGPPNVRRTPNPAAAPAEPVMPQPLPVSDMPQPSLAVAANIPVLNKTPAPDAAPMESVAPAFITPQEIAPRHQRMGQRKKQQEQLPEIPEQQHNVQPLPKGDIPKIAPLPQTTEEPKLVKRPIAPERPTAAPTGSIDDSSTPLVTPQPAADALRYQNPTRPATPPAPAMPEPAPEKPADAVMPANKFLFTDKTVWEMENKHQTTPPLDITGADAAAPVNAPAASAIAPQNAGVTPPTPTPAPARIDPKIEAFAKQYIDGVNAGYIRKTGEPVRPLNKRDGIITPEEIKAFGERLTHRDAELRRLNMDFDSDGKNTSEDLRRLKQAYGLSDHAIEKSGLPEPLSAPEKPVAAKPEPVADTKENEIEAERLRAQAVKALLATLDQNGNGLDVAELAVFLDPKNRKLLDLVGSDGKVTRADIERLYRAGHDGPVNEKGAMAFAANLARAGVRLDEEGPNSPRQTPKNPSESGRTH